MVFLVRYFITHELSHVLREWLHQWMTYSELFFLRKNSTVSDILSANVLWILDFFHIYCSMDVPMSYIGSPYDAQEALYPGLLCTANFSPGDGKWCAVVIKLSLSVRIGRQLWV